MSAHSHTVSTTRGGEIRVIEAGHPDGTPVLVHHGTPGSRLLFSKWIDDARSRGIRLISYDRPGYGGSTPRPGRDVASAAEEVAAIAKELGLDRMLVWGVSGGGPHALACAALLPNLVAAAAVLTSPAPYGAEAHDWFAEMGEDNVVEFGVALAGRDALVESLETAAPGTMNTDSSSLVQALRPLLSPADAEVLNQDIADYLVAGMREGIKARRDGWVDDDIALTTPWGFEPSRIRVPVMLMHGEQDRFAPFSHGEWLARNIVHANALLSANDGHLTLVFRRIPEVHAWLLSKM